MSRSFHSRFVTLSRTCHVHSTAGLRHCQLNRRQPCLPGSGTCTAATTRARHVPVPTSHLTVPATHHLVVGHGWPWLAMVGHGWPCLSIFALVCLCVSMFVYVCLCVSMFESVCLCLSMCLYVCPWLRQMVSETCGVYKYDCHCFNDYKTSENKARLLPTLQALRITLPSLHRAVSRNT